MQFIPDPECEEIFQPYQVAYTYLTTDVSGEINTASYEMASSSAECSSALTMNAVISTVRDPRTGYIYNFSSSGTWTIDWARSFIYLAASQAIYNWPTPPDPEGWYGYNMTQGSSNGFPRIKLSSGRAHCLGPGKVTFFSHYDVQITDPAIKRNGYGPNAGEDPSDPQSENCYQQYIIIEVLTNSGWTRITAGYTTVCYWT